jgi:hypothetical protein
MKHCLTRFQPTDTTWLHWSWTLWHTNARRLNKLRCYCQPASSEARSHKFKFCCKELLSHGQEPLSLVALRRVLLQVFTQVQRVRFRFCGAAKRQRLLAESLATWKCHSQVANPKSHCQEPLSPVAQVLKHILTQVQSATSSTKSLSSNHKVKFCGQETWQLAAKSERTNFDKIHTEFISRRVVRAEGSPPCPLVVNLKVLFLCQVSCIFPPPLPLYTLH